MEASDEPTPEEADSRAADTAAANAEITDPESVGVSTPDDAESEGADDDIVELDVRISPSWRALHGETFAIFATTSVMMEVAILVSSPRVESQRMSLRGEDKIVTSGFHIESGFVETGRLRMEARATADLAFSLIRKIVDEDMLPRDELASRIARLIEVTKLYETTEAPADASAPEAPK